MSGWIYQKKTNRWRIVLHNRDDDNKKQYYEISENTLLSDLSYDLSQRLNGAAVSLYADDKKLTELFHKRVIDLKGKTLSYDAWNDYYDDYYDDNSW